MQFALGRLAVIASFLVLHAATSRAYTGQLEKACKAEISKRLREWSVSSVAVTVAEWAKSHRINPTMVIGDFDGDGHRDIAVLIQNRLDPVLDDPKRADSSLVAVCLSRTKSPILHLIDNPYCSDLVELSRKGRRYHDFEKRKSNTYPRDGVKTVCFEKASATYVYDAKSKSFRRIVDGD